LLNIKFITNKPVLLGAGATQHVWIFVHFCVQIYSRLDDKLGFLNFFGQKLAFIGQGFIH
jgi:hypothetical protein